MKKLIKTWLQKKLRNWVFDGVDPNRKEHKLIHIPTNSIKLRSTARWSKIELQELHLSGGMSEPQIVEMIKRELLNTLFEELKKSDAIEIIQYEEPVGVSMNDQGIHFEAKLTVVKPKQ